MPDRVGLVLGLVGWGPGVGAWRVGAWGWRLEGGGLGWGPGGWEHVNQDLPVDHNTISCVKQVLEEVSAL